ncbi:hypothetical protein MNBD_IGNAVI01-1594, partial [hydrothermal vent metagenome]
EKPTEALAVAEIGPGGGTVKTNDVSIVVPSGAFNEKHNVAIYSVADDGAFGENTVSSSFKISGLPNDYTKAIKIKMKYTGELSGQSFIAAGDKVFDDVSGDTTTVYNLFQASDSSGYLIGILPASVDASLSKRESTEFGDPFYKIINAVTAYNWLQTENFSISYPRTLEFNASFIAAVLEDAYSIVINDLGFSFNNYLGKWNVTVVVQKEAVNDDFGFLSHKLNISRDMVRLGKYSEIKLAMGISLINLGIDDSYSQISSNMEGDNYYWLEVAIKTWAEELFTDDPNFQYPAKFTANAMAPFNGMRAGAGTDYDRDIFNKHGYGMSSMIKYLVDDTRYGKTGIGKTYQDIGKGVDPIAALINNMDAMVTDWWPDFIKTYMNGEIYHLPNDYFLDYAKLEWNINDENDILKIFASSDPAVKFYPDLSAKLFKINLNYANFDASSSMLFSMKGPVTEDGLSLIVFGIQNGEQVYLGTASAQDLEIPNLKEYYDNNMRQFLVVLVNCLGGSPFLGESDIDLTIKINKKDESILSLTKCIVSVKTLTVIHREFNDGSQDDLIKYTTFLSDYALGSFNGNVYTGTYDIYGVQGTIIITLNDAQNEILSINWQKTYNDGSGETSFTGMNIPLSSNISGEFSLLGSTVCGAISALTYSGQTSSETFNLQSFSCDEESHIYVNFSKDQ